VVVVVDVAAQAQLVIVQAAALAVAVLAQVMVTVELLKTELLTQEAVVVAFVTLQAQPETAEVVLS
jgi:hypothetical protein